MIMEKDKSRGLKHITNKQKYKGNSTKNPKCVPSKSKSHLVSNWDRYEVNDTDRDSSLVNSLDFSVLASAPLSQGKHFQFRNEKLVSHEIQTDSTNSLFNLDLVKLEESILTVPFFERLSIDERTFSKQQIEVMKAEAKECDERLMKKNMLSNFESFLPEDEALFPEIPDDSTEVDVRGSLIIEKSDELEDWLEDILNE